MARKYWYPGGFAAQLAMYANVNAKIGTYAAVLPLTAPQVAKIELICETFQLLMTYVDQIQATTVSLIEWRDMVLTGFPMGDPAPAHQEAASQLRWGWAFRSCP